MQDENKFEMGVGDFNVGTKLEDNPFYICCSAYYEWERGWNFACLETMNKALEEAKNQPKSPKPPKAKRVKEEVDYSTLADMLETA